MRYVLHINGWPGTGKRTIGKIVADRIGGRLLDNHVMLNPAEALFERGDPLHASLRDAVREATLEHAERLAPDVSIVLTDALSDDAEDTASFARYRRLAERRGSRLISVVLEIAPEENARRLVSPGRSDALKLTRVEVLEAMRSRYLLLRPTGIEVIDLDVTELSAAAAAGQIVDLLMRSGPDADTGARPDPTRPR